MPSVKAKSRDEEITDLVTLLSILVTREGGSVVITDEELKAACRGPKMLDATFQYDGSWVLEVKPVTHS